MTGHHLILGELVDAINGESLPDTHDERYRQKIARLLIEERGFRREELTPRIPITLHVGGKPVRLRLDLIVCIDEQIAMLIKYAPGSLTTRHQVALAASRLLAPFQVPFSIVTNGEDADLIDNFSNSVVAQGLEGIFTREELVTRLRSRAPIVVTDFHRDLAERILHAYEVDGRCPCDDTVCEFEQR